MKKSIRRGIGLFSLLLLVGFAVPKCPASPQHGKMGPEDVKTLLRQAEAGDAQAQFNLGLCYDNGDGVEKDLAEAAKWYRQAAEQGLAQAQQRLEELQQ